MLPETKSCKPYLVMQWLNVDFRTVISEISDFLEKFLGAKIH
jgi:hypothetical protein